MVSAENRARRYTYVGLGRPQRVALGTWDGESFVHGGYLDVEMEFGPDGALASVSRGAGSPSHQWLELERSTGEDGTTVTATTPVGVASATFGVDGWLQTVTNALGEAAFAIDGDGVITGYRPEQGDWHAYNWPIDDADGSYVPEPDFPDRGAPSYAFADDGALQSAKPFDLPAIVIEYDEVGRVQTVTSDDGVWSIDYQNHLPDTVSDPAGGILRHGYANGLMQSIQRKGDETNGAPYSMTWELDDELHLGSEAINGAHAIAYDYDDDDLLTGARALATERHPVLGTVETTTLGAVTMELDYDTHTQLRSRTYSALGATIYDQTLSYDHDGRISIVVETVQGAVRTIGYQYDPAGRLERVTVDGETVDEIVYGAHLDWSSRTHDGMSGGAAFDGNGRLQELHDTTYTYDPNGRRVTASGPGGDFTYDYDSFAQLRAIPSHGIEYVCDGWGRRVGKRVDGELERRWLYRNLYQVLAELDGDGQVSKRFVYATRYHVPDYMVFEGELYQLVTDVRGSVRLAVHAGSGEAVQRLDYDSWGRVLVDTAPGFQPFGFAGGLYDADTGLLHFGARDYDPEVGRFLQPDPESFLAKAICMRTAPSTPSTGSTPTARASARLRSTHTPPSSGRAPWTSFMEWGTRRPSVPPGSFATESTFSTASVPTNAASPTSSAASRAINWPAPPSPQRSPRRSSVESCTTEPTGSIESSLCRTADRSTAAAVAHTAR